MKSANLPQSAICDTASSSSAIFDSNYFFALYIFRYCLIHADFQLLLHFFTYVWSLLAK